MTSLEKKLLESLAKLEHEQWAHWIKYEKSQKELMWLDFFNETSKPQFDSNIMERWILLALTPYDKLTEKEKESDREWARKALVIFKGEVADKIRERIDQLKKIRNEQCLAGDLNSPNPSWHEAYGEQRGLEHFLLLLVEPEPTLKKEPASSSSEESE